MSIFQSKDEAETEVVMLRIWIDGNRLKQLFSSVLHFLCGLIIAHRERFVVE